MFCEGQIRNCTLVKKSIIGGIEGLLKKVKDLIIVTNNVFEDGITFDISFVVDRIATNERHHRIGFCR